MAEWKTLDRELFVKCTEQLKIDEFMFTDQMNTHDIMSALEVNSKRIDSQLLAKGLFDLSDLIASGITFPDEKITFDEIRGIIGKLFDLQISRFCGHSIYQTTLISVYVSKKLEIKNKLLKYVTNAFCHVISSVEEYVNKSLLNSNAYWTMTRDYANYMQDLIDEGEIRAFLNKEKENNKEISDIIDTALYELDFAKYIKEFPNSDVPELPENFVKISSELGVHPTIHFRKLPVHSPPAKVDIYDHEKSIEIFKEFLGMCKEVRNFKECETVEEILDFAFNWGLSHKSAVSLVRILIAGHVLQEEGETYYHKVKAADFLKKDITRYKIPDTFFKHEDYSIIARNIVYFLDNVLHAFLGPVAYAQASFNKALFPEWNSIERGIIALEQAVGKNWSYPITGSKDLDQIIKMTTILWCAPIATKLTQFFVKLGFESDTYNSDDYPIGAVILASSYRTQLFVSDRKMKYEAVIKAEQHKKNPKKRHVTLKQADIDKFISIPDDFFDSRALHHYMLGCFHLMRWCFKKGAIKPHRGIFHDPVATYYERASNPNQMFSIECMSKEEYGQLFTYKNVPEERIVADAKAHFEQAKKFLMDGMTQQGKTEARTNLLRSIIIALSVFMWKEGMKVEVSFPAPGDMKFTLIK